MDGYMMDFVDSTYGKIVTIVALTELSMLLFFMMPIIQDTMQILRTFLNSTVLISIICMIGITIAITWISIIQLG